MEPSESSSGPWDPFPTPSFEHHELHELLLENSWAKSWMPETFAQLCQPPASKEPKRSWHGVDMALEGNMQPARLRTRENGQRSPFTLLQPKQSKVKSCETVVAPDPVLVEHRAMQTGFLWSLFKGQWCLLRFPMTWSMTWWTASLEWPTQAWDCAAQIKHLRLVLPEWRWWF